MPKFKLYVEEVLSREVEVEASDDLEALEKVHKMYEDEEIVLDNDDHINTNIDLVWTHKERGTQQDDM